MTQQAFVAALATWQNFYLLVGTGAATLVGLMFVAVTFGSGIVTPTESSARAFLDPTLTHFVQVLLTACFVTIPTMSPKVLGVLLCLIAVLRSVSLVGIHAHMKAAQRRANDLELSDWVSGVVLPFLCHLFLGASGVGFFAGYPMAFNGLAIVTILAPQRCVRRVGADGVDGHDEEPPEVSRAPWRLAAWPSAVYFCALPGSRTVR